MKIPPVTWIGTFGQRLGLEFKRLETGLAEAELLITPEHCNPNGVCHGGTIFTLADESMGAAAHSITPEGLVPTSLQVDVHYSRSAKPGDSLRVSTEALAHGRRTAVLESRVSDGQGRLVALLSASYMFVEPRS
jgi:uncharacterized protein (TIGR00369 family)